MEERSRGSFEAFDAVEVESGGRTLRLRALTVREAIPLFRMAAKAETGDPDAMYEFMESFASTVGLEDETLSPFELFEVARSFFRLPSWGPMAREKTGTDQSSTQDSTT